ncbi:hypothetical protein ACLB2K_030391 [Fragaria x ananassa]
MTSKEAEVVVFNLPEDVVVNILCRLPVKSLIRFSCVSKRWRSIIISDSQFAKSTFQLASQSKILRQRLLFSNYPCYRNSSRFQCLGGLDLFRRKLIGPKSHPPASVHTRKGNAGLMQWFGGSS